MSLLQNYLQRKNLNEKEAFERIMVQAIAKVEDRFDIEDMEDLICNIDYDTNIITLGYKAHGFTIESEFYLDLDNNQIQYKSFNNAYDPYNDLQKYSYERYSRYFREYMDDMKWDFIDIDVYNIYGIFRAIIKDWGKKYDDN